MQINITFLDNYSDEEIYHYVLWKNRRIIVTEIKFNLHRIVKRLKQTNIIPDYWNLDDKAKLEDNSMAMLDMIGNLGEEGFNGFLAALHDCSYHTLADRLRLKQKQIYGPHEASAWQRLSRLLE